jgi:hypothetical protein
MICGAFTIVLANFTLAQTQSVVITRASTQAPSPAQANAAVRMENELTPFKARFDRVRARAAQAEAKAFTPSQPGQLEPIEITGSRDDDTPTPPISIGKGATNAFDDKPRIANERAGKPVIRGAPIMGQAFGTWYDPSNIQFWLRN